MLKFLQRTFRDHIFPLSNLNHFSYATLAFQERLASSFKEQYNPSSSLSTQYSLPSNSLTQVENRLVRNWSQLVSFPLDPSTLHLFEYNKKHHRPLEIPADQKLFNTPCQSFYEASMLLSSSKELQHSLRSYRSATVRLDLLFDLLDCLAGLSAFSHCYSLDENHGLRNIIIVTAAVDHIQFFKPWLINKDLRIRAYPSWCGSSVIEIRIDLFQNSSGIAEEMVGNAIFLMAARDPNNTKLKYKVPQLSFDGEIEKDKCEARFNEGKRNQDIRKINAGYALDVPPPTAEEVSEMHEIFKLCEKGKAGVNFIYQEDTKIYKTLMMHPQNQNLYGTV